MFYHLSYWVKISADEILKYFLICFNHKIGFDVSCKLSPKRDNLHAMTNPIS